MKSFKFVRENDYRWFAVIPEWQGSKEDLEMVMGADTMLDYIAQEKNEVVLTLSEEEFKGYDYLLNFLEEAYDGGIYHLTGKNVDFAVWLCDVTKFVFGCFPSKIYIK